MNQVNQTTPWIRRRLIVVGLVSLFAAWLALWTAYQPYAGIRHVINTRVEQTPWVWVDAVTRSSGGTFEGQLFLPNSRVIRIANTANAHLRLTLNGVLVHEGIGGDVRIPDTVASPAQFSLEYAVDGVFPARGIIGLEEETLPNVWAVIPAWQFAPDNVFLDAVRLVFAFALAAAVLSLLFSLRLSRQQWIIVILLFATALAVRLIILADKFNLDPTTWTMELVWDNYVRMGREWLGGVIRVGGNEFQQGTFIYLGMLQYLIGPALQNLYILHAILGALVPVMIMGAGWLLFNRNVGILAGMLALFYPPLIHYQLTLQDTPVLILVVSAALLGLAAYKCSKSMAVLIALGVLLGIGTLFRSTMLVLLLALAGTVWLGESTLWRRLRLIGMSTIAALFFILPVTAANLVAGVPTLTANLLDYQLFRSNNLNSVGLNTVDTQSEQLARLRQESWRDALLRETARNPERLVELTARRIGLFWDSVEHADSGMIDYQTSGLDVSPLLRALTLGGVVTQWSLMAAAGVGIILGLFDQKKRSSTLILVLALGAYLVSLVGFYVIGRVRIPASPILILLAALAVIGVIRSRNYLRTTLALAGSVGLGILMMGVVNSLPRPNFVTQPSASLIQTSAQFDDTLRLLGYAYYDTDYQANGYVTFEITWQSLRGTDIDYVVSVLFVDTASNTIVASQEFTLGSLSTPPASTSTWSDNSIFYERYVLRLPEHRAGYDLYVGVFDPVNNHLLSVSDTARPVLADHVRLTAVAVDLTENGSVPTAPLATWGNALTLGAASCVTDALGQSHVELSWYVDQRIPDDMTLFLHAVRAGEVIAQRDARPIQAIPLDGLPVSSIFNTQWDVDGNVDLIGLGFYDWAVNRWEITQSSFPETNNTLEIRCS